MCIEKMNSSRGKIEMNTSKMRMFISRGSDETFIVNIFVGKVLIKESILSNKLAVQQKAESFKNLFDPDFEIISTFNYN